MGLKNWLIRLIYRHARVKISDVADLLTSMDIDDDGYVSLAEVVMLLSLLSKKE